MKNPIQLTKAIVSSRAPFHRSSLRRDFLLSSLVVALASCVLSLTRVQAECREGCSEDLNTFLGENALFSNTTGISNVAEGNGVLYYNTTGSYNTANGAEALENNQTGSDNTASGYLALFNNTTGSNNMANGFQALYSSTSGIWNTANGVQALYGNTTGVGNTAEGLNALFSNTTGSNNTANGVAALNGNTTGSSNIALGNGAGLGLTTGSYNIDIGNAGVAGEANTIRIGTTGTHTNAYIAGIYKVTAAKGIAVCVDSNGHLGTSTSSKRFKEAIQPMDKASEAILSLEPVTFRYNHELDPDGIPQFGLVAEEVEKVNPRSGRAR
jgi:trimeric autotransporter adhesin